MIQSRCAPCVLAAVLAFTTISGGAADAQRKDDKKASLSLTATPPVGFSPLRVRFRVDVRGGPNDAEELYCASVEWDWGDDQKSEASQDCEPYVAGKSTITRSYSTERIFNTNGSYNVRFRLKQGSRIVASTSTTVQVRRGVKEDFDN
jgi:hypothetical protein